LRAAAELAGTGERSVSMLLQAAGDAMEPFDVEPEYLAIVDPDTFQALDSIQTPAMLVLAARVGAVRLIDNILLQPVAVHALKTAGTSVSAQNHLSTGATTCSA
jgi:pantoate--beta-alanine ligase